MRSSHLRTPQFCSVSYRNGAGDVIVYTQQHSEKEIKGFDDMGGTGQTVQLKDGEGLLLRESENLSVYWFDRHCAYVLTTNLPKEDALHLADTVNPNGDDDFSLQKVRLEIIPAQYTKQLAEESRDIIKDGMTKESRDRVAAFYENHRRGMADAIRICEFSEENLLISDLQTHDRRVYLTDDTTRVVGSRDPKISGKEYTDIAFVHIALGKITLTLSGAGGEKQIVLN